jgi:hypothetical protein
LLDVTFRQAHPIAAAVEVLKASKARETTQNLLLTDGVAEGVRVEFRARIHALLGFILAGRSDGRRTRY